MTSVVIQPVILSGGAATRSPLLRKTFTKQVGVGVAVAAFFQLDLRVETVQ